MFYSIKKGSYFCLVDRRVLNISKKKTLNFVCQNEKKTTTLCVCRSNAYTIINNSCEIFNGNLTFFFWCVSRCYKGSEDCRKIHNTINIFLQWSVYMYLHVIDWIRETLKKIFNKGCIFFTLIPSLNYSNSYTLIVS